MQTSDGARYDSLVRSLDDTPCLDAPSRWFMAYQRTLSAFTADRFMEADSAATAQLAALTDASRSLQTRYHGRLLVTRARTRFRMGRMKASVADYETAQPLMDALSWQRKYHAMVYGAEAYLVLGDSASVTKARLSLLSAQQVLESPAAPSTPHVNDLRRQLHAMLSKLYADHAGLAFPSAAPTSDAALYVPKSLLQLLLGIILLLLIALVLIPVRKSEPAAPDLHQAG